MLIAITTLYSIFCILLIIVVLLQQSKGGMLGGGSDTLLGASSGDVFTRTTAILAVIFVVGAIFLSVISVGKKSLIDTDKNPAGKAAPTEEAAPATVPGALTPTLSNTSAPTP